MGPKTAAAGNAAGSCEKFDDAQLEKTSWQAALFSWAFSYPVHRWWLGFVRAITPVLRIPFLNWAIVLRYDEVREVLSHDAEFPVPWDRKMVSVTGGADGGRNFVLGMARDSEYRLSYEQLAQAFPLTDVKDYVVPLSRKAAERVVTDAGGNAKPQFDAIQDLITAVPTQLCEDYYGIGIPDKVALARWTLAISSYLFGPPFDKPKALRTADEPPVDTTSDDALLAHNAAACLRRVIRAAIDEARARRKAGTAQVGPVLPRLLEMQAADPRISDDVIHAQLFGMVLGFIPTNVLAGGNVLETLLLQPSFMRRARGAAVAGDDGLLWRCLREALRFRNINPGPWRVCVSDYTLNRGGWDEVQIRPGTAVLASTQAAMFDRRRIERPSVFDPDRADEDYLVFSTGQHWCLGAYIAIAQITQTFKPLLKREGLEAAAGKPGCMQRFRVFPLHMRVEFKP